jgi:hypothetical protein
MSNRVFKVKHITHGTTGIIIKAKGARGSVEYLVRWDGGDETWVRWDEVESVD